VVVALIKFSLDLILIFMVYRNFFKSFLLKVNNIELKNNFISMQWRIAATGMSNYFAFSLFTPVMFYFHGPVIAGKMGMTWALIMSVQSMGVMWIYPKIPQFNKFIALNDFLNLDNLWKKELLNSTILVSVGVTTVWILIFVMNSLQLEYARRLLPPFETGLLAISAIVLQIFACLGVYLRAHRREPFLFLGLIGNGVIGVLVVFMGMNFGSVGAVASFLCIQLALLPFAIKIWKNFRTKWHIVQF
jgi:uncharacterized membrane protein